MLPPPPCYGKYNIALDKDEAVQEEVRNCARALLAQVVADRAGRLADPGARLEEPRPK